MIWIGIIFMQKWVIEEDWYRERVHLPSPRWETSFYSFRRLFSCSNQQIQRSRKSNNYFHLDFLCGTTSNRVWLSSKRWIVISAWYPLLHVNPENVVSWTTTIYTRMELLILTMWILCYEGSRWKFPEFRKFIIKLTRSSVLFTSTS